MLPPLGRLAMLTGHFARIADKPYAVISALVMVLVLVTAAASVWT